MVKALLFDVDGTLAETEALHRRAFNEAFAAAGLPWRWTPQRYAELLRVAGGRERIAHFQSAYPHEAAGIVLDPDAIATIHRDKNVRYAQMLAQGALPLRPGVVRLAQEAAASGARVAIVTTTSPENVAALLAALWPDDAPPFAAIITAREAPQKKPDPQAYHVALARLDIAPSEAIAIEDTAHGAQAAAAAGIPVLVTESEYGKAPEYPGAFAVVDHLGEPDLPARWLRTPQGRGEGVVTWALLTRWAASAVPPTTA
ncbi:HAD-IA family hydrolase [Hydrogenophilus thermoluteolus]|uniref:CbbY n=1 Tax=Hydrogenophilus thermoluteolus TaxID=297 RepID=A0A2Z6DXB5_HYDTE|nr:HAD-IA family hydrolase [Hydrogenophilus thermoluteolus]BBD77103.1 CbbY [Hydrogenophilus thermoluteolus]